MISDTISHLTDDTFNEALIIYLALIGIVDVFIDFESFNDYCLIGRLKLMYVWNSRLASRTAASAAREDFVVDLAQLFINK